MEAIAGFGTRSSTQVQIEFVLDGRPDRRDVADVRGVAFELSDRVRVPSSWKHKRNYEGYYWAATIGRHVWFESLYERAALMQFDRDRQVTGIAAQPMFVHWGDRDRRHAPDFFVRYCDGRGVVVDVRPADRIGERDAETFRWTGEMCEALGWGYLLVSDISETEHRCLRFLSGYRYRRWISEPALERFTACAGDARTLRRWAELIEDVCPDPLGAVYAAVWWRHLHVELGRNLSLNSEALAVA